MGRLLNSMLMIFWLKCRILVTKTPRTDREDPHPFQSGNIFTLRCDLIRQYFDAETFDFKSYKQLLADFDTSVITTEEPKPIPIIIEMPASAPIPAAIPAAIPAIDREAQLAKVRAEILKYESGEKQPKHIGHRMFGLLIRAGYFTAYNDEQRYEAWKEFTGIEQRPEMSYLRDLNIINK